MSVRGRYVNYTAVTLTVSVLATVFFVSQCSRSLIPPPTPNALGVYNVEFLNRAKFQSIDWHTMDDDPFARARSKDRPLMVFVGSAWSLSAKRYDEAVFGSREVAARLNRDFVSVRIDLSAEPEWRGALLPVSRSGGSFDPGFTVWFLEPDGEIIDWVTRSDWEPKDDYKDFHTKLSFINYVRSIGWDDLSSVTKAETLKAPRDENEQLLFEMEQKRTQQRSVSEVLSGSSVVQGVPSIDSFVESLRNPKQFENWNASKYRVLIQAGGAQAAVTLIEPRLLSPRTDLVDGGFFWLSSGDERPAIEFGKLATDQAEMAAVLAYLWRATGDELYLYHANRALESVFGQFLVDSPWPSFIEVDTAKNSMSARHSFSAPHLRTEFDREQRDWAANVGLIKRENSQMVPFLVSAETLTKDREQLDKFVKELQKRGDISALAPGGFDHLDSAGTTVARAIEAARVLGDADLLERALKKSEQLENYRAGPDEVRHAPESDQGTDVWLGDFTAYADAMMEVYAATGDEEKLIVGKRVLARALLLFGTEDDTVFVAATGQRPDMGVLSLYMPSITDDGQPPALPALIRLAFRYGAITNDKNLVQTAVLVSERYSQIANQNPTSFTSFISAAHEVMLSGCLIVAGEDRVERAKQLSTQSPGQFVAPAMSGQQEPGVYRALSGSVVRLGD